MSNSQHTTEENESDLVSRYLLGELSGEQQTLIEERYFTDPSFLELLETVEDDLIDAYVRKEMSPLERQRFEEHFLASPGRRERTAQAEALMQHLTQRNSLPDASRLKTGSQRQFRLYRIAAAAALIVILVGGILLFRQNASLRRENDQFHSERQDLERSLRELEQELASERSGKDSPDDGRVDPNELIPAPDTAPPGIALTASFTLAPGNARGDDGLKEVSFSAAITTIRFDLPIDFPAENRTARAVLTRPGGPEIWSRGRLPVRKTQGAIAVSLLVPARLLQPGEYRMTLIAEGEASLDNVMGDYAFRVTSRQKPRD